jgi:hypothetical protein
VTSFVNAVESSLEGGVLALLGIGAASKLLSGQSTGGAGCKSNREQDTGELHFEQVAQ